MTPPMHTTSPIGAASFAAQPEFVDSKGLLAYFGISRSMGYFLADAGLVRTVCLRRPGTTRGKRLWIAETVRDYLNANIDERKK